MLKPVPRNRRMRSLMRSTPAPWRCGVCGEVMFRTKDVTIDHIIPKSKGGANALSNLQLAHRKCNELKADKYSTTKVQSKIRHEKGDGVGLQGPTLDDNRMGGIDRHEARHVPCAPPKGLHVRPSNRLREVPKPWIVFAPAKGPDLSIEENPDSQKCVRPAEQQNQSVNSTAACVIFRGRCNQTVKCAPTKPI